MTTTEKDVTVELGINKAIRCPWATLDEPRKFKDEQGRESGEPKFSATFLIPNEGHDDLAAHKKAVLGILKEKYGAALSFKDGKALLNAGAPNEVTLKLPFSDGDAESLNAMENGKDRSFCAGHTLLKTSSQYPVPIYDGTRRDSKGVPVLIGVGGAEIDAQLKTTIKNAVYNGCFVAAQIKYRTYNKVGSNPPGVTAYIQKICFVHDGDRIVSEGQSGDVFTGVQGAVSSEDPTAGAELDDEIPF